MKEKKDEYTPNFENQEDHLRLMFVNYFIFMKYFEGKFTPEHIKDAITAALYGLDSGFNKKEYLDKIIAGFPKIVEVAELEAQQREAMTQYKSGEEFKTYTQKQAKVPKEAMKLKDVIAEFGLSENNIKDKKWRDDHNFPYNQIREGGSVTYMRSEVAEWLKEHNKATKK